uniref:Tyrosine-protein phosphatase YVH1 n=1 Tax=Ganoderma boninense TaxID=34458 RepID=A0A5K1K3K3_9APHY|nr:Tyrosine-protein phosphatase YVH1 [Ganoderma boninense]
MMADTTDSASLCAPAVPASLEQGMDMGKIPDWLLTHPELRKRQIIVHEPLQPFTVYQTKWLPEGPIHVVKTLKPSRPEADIYDLLDRHSGSPTDHTIPHELIRCECPLVVMPFVSGMEYAMTYKTSAILAVFAQILEAVEHMHRLRIAHGDIFTPNIVAATEEDAKRDARLSAGRVYLIDFESSRQFECGPGLQTAVPLPDTHIIPPLGMTTFDPFSWDVYCLGLTFEGMIEVGLTLTMITAGSPGIDMSFLCNVQERFIFKPEAIPWIPVQFARWLKGNEAGCPCSRPVRAVAELLTATVRYPTTLFRAPRAGPD